MISRAQRDQLRRLATQRNHRITARSGPIRVTSGCMAREFSNDERGYREALTFLASAGQAEEAVKELVEA